MKKIIVAAALSLLTTAALAGATLEPNTNSKSNGSPVGKASSAAKGNGDWVGGNGTGNGPWGPADQTTTPGSRAAEVHGLNTGKPGQIGK